MQSTVLEEPAQMMRLPAKLIRNFRSKGVFVDTDFDDLVAVNSTTTKFPQGFSVLRGAIPPSTQQTLARLCIYEWSCNSGFNNLIASGELVTTTTTKSLSKLTWSTLGYHYDWTSRKYVQGWKNEFPSPLAELCEDLARRAGHEGKYSPTAAIVNYYPCAKKQVPLMLPHRDDAELTMKKPIVSISLGCSGVFCIETKPAVVENSSAPSSRGGSEMVAVLLRSGDVCVMDGESRMALHAVASVVEGTCPEGWFNETDELVVEYMKAHRLNINTRQVEGDTQAEQWR
jgi:DNA alkylation damage repair protein AlkB